MSVDTEQARTCQTCSHTFDEHKLVGFLDPTRLAVHSAVGYCYCCDCPAFTPEPDTGPTPAP